MRTLCHNMPPAAVILLSAFLLIAAGCGDAKKGEPVEPAGGEFVIDATGIDRGEVKFFRYMAGEVPVVFFVARTSSGGIKTAFDACITCYRHKLGYEKQEACVVCVFCGTSFDIDKLDVGLGNCVPIAIGHRLRGGKVVIAQKDVESGARWF